MVTRLLHAADLHLGSPLAGLSARDPALAALFDDASRKAFRALVDLAVEERVDAVVIAGDVFDRDWKDFSVGQAFVREISRLTRAGIRVAMIRGNHDAESVVSRQLPLPDGVSWLGSDRPETLDWADLGLAVHGISFKSRSIAESVVHRYPAPIPGRFNVGLLHTSLAGGSGHDPYAPCTVQDLASRGYDYWALGHIHARAVVNAEGPVVVFPGNIQGRSIREPGAKSVTLATVDGAALTGLEDRPVDAARWAIASADLSGVATSQELERRLEAGIERAAGDSDGRPLAVRLRLTGEKPSMPLPDRVLLRETAQALAGHLSERILIEKIVLDLSAAPESLPSPIPGLATVLASAEDDPAYHAALAADLALLREKLPAAAAAMMDEDPRSLAAAARALLLSRLEAG